MARAIITLEFDGGSTIEVTETSAYPITGGAPGAQLVQAGFEKIIRAVGLQVVTPEEADAETTPPPEETATAKEKKA